MLSQKERTHYANLMDEVKFRISVIDNVAQGRTLTGYPTPILREFCYLQLRFLCELIALSCLVAHGDIKSLQAHRTGKSYSAYEILDRLEKLRPHFYPVACKLAKKVDDHNFHFDEVKPCPLEKSELLKLYGKTHKRLHKGSLKKLLSSDEHIDMKIDVPEIIHWAQRINDLLSTHKIAIDDDNIIMCTLRNPDDNLKVQVVIAAAKKSS